VTVDANHRMAGKDLVFDLHLVAICDGPSDPGHGHGCGSCGCGHDH
jgi:FKBP-type peptidyl-prolyl cis-trans isomerase 2